MYNSEEEFLSNYDSSKYNKLSMRTDILIVSVSDEPISNYRKTERKSMSILLNKRTNFPFKGKWCLPGGFLDINEDLEDCPRRILERETNIKNIYLEQLYTFGDVNRDPRMRIVSTAYIALIDKHEIKEELSSNSCWFNITLLEKDNIVNLTLDNGKEKIELKIKKELYDLTTDRFKFISVDNDSLAFDNSIVILSGIERLRNKCMYTDIVFNMMPETFALGDLQRVYEVILGKKLIAPAFRRIIADKVIKTEEKKTGGGHRPSALFKYNK